MALEAVSPRCSSSRADHKVDEAWIPPSLQVESSQPPSFVKDKQMIVTFDAFWSKQRQGSLGCKEVNTFCTKVFFSMSLNSPRRQSPLSKCFLVARHHRYYSLSPRKNILKDPEEMLSKSAETL